MLEWHLVMVSKGDVRCLLENLSNTSYCETSSQYEVLIQEEFKERLALRTKLRKSLYWLPSAAGNNHSWKSKERPQWAEGLDDSLLSKWYHWPWVCTSKAHLVICPIYRMELLWMENANYLLIITILCWMLNITATICWQTDKWKFRTVPLWRYLVHDTMMIKPIRQMVSISHGPHLYILKDVGIMNTSGSWIM